MTRRRPRPEPWERGGGIPGSLSGPPLAPEAFTGAGGRRIRQRRHARSARSGNWHAPAWLIAAIFLCILAALVITIILTA